MHDLLDNVSSLERTVRPGIPLNVYQPIKRCPNCQSIYLTDDKCEACGRSLNYHPVGDPFSAKSLYGLKERYHQSLPIYVRYYPRFEVKTNALAQSYRRHLNKRLTHLVSALSSNDIIDNDKRRFFYIELMELMDELLRYGESEHVIRNKVEEGLGFSVALITRDLIFYLENSTLELRKLSQTT
jgi:rRNA maturation protein Nop10